MIGDGDYAMASNAFWTAAHMEIPMLVVVANNRSYYNDVAHQERMAVVRNRPVANKFIGQEMIEPDLDIVAIAKGHGIDGEGPVERAADLAAALKRGEARGARRQDLSDRRARRRPHPGCRRAASTPKAGRNRSQRRRVIRTRRAATPNPSNGSTRKN